MKLTLQRNYYEVIGITTIVFLSILIAFGVEKFLFRYTTLSADATKLTFALILPVILLALQFFKKKFIDTIIVHDGVDNFAVRPKLIHDQVTTKAICIIENNISNFLKTQYSVAHFTLAIFDWQSRQYVTLKDDNYQVLQQSHALVHFAKQFHAVFCTERRSSLVDRLPNALHAEISVFMQKYNYMFAIPLYTEQDVYGFIFLKHHEVMNSRLYATNDFLGLEQLGRSFGSMLHRTLIYQAIVIGK